MRIGHPVVVTAYGVTVEILVQDPTLVPDVVALLPPGCRFVDHGRVACRFVLGPQGTVARDGETVVADMGRTAALAAFDSALRAVVALEAPDRVFIHAGVVARKGKAMVLPGGSFWGKTTLVAALVCAGAEYYSDEYAVLDQTGAVHPYPKPLSIRPPGAFTQVDVPVERLGGVAGQDPAEVALIVSAPHDPSVSGWAPARGSAGEGALALLEHAIAARKRSAAALAAVGRAADAAVFLKGPRGDAHVTARILLSMLEGPDATHGTLPENGVSA